MKPLFGDQFYPLDFNQLNKQIENSFYSKLGPGSLPVKRKNKRLLGVIVPHAGYVYSGPAAAWAYKEIAEHRFADTYVILAPDHYGFSETIMTSDEVWDMPFGKVEVDKGFIMELLNKCKFVKKGKIAEHAVEVQLPFLQYACRDKLRELKIVPLVIPSKFDFVRLAEAITEINENVCVIASSDFTHYGNYYGFVPFKFNVKERIKQLDIGAIEFIQKLDSEHFLDYIKKTKATICGKFAISAAIEVVKELFGKKALLLNYYTSGDITKDYSSSVSYAALKFV